MVKDYIINSITLLKFSSLNKICLNGLELDKNFNIKFYHLPNSVKNIL